MKHLAIAIMLIALALFITTVIQVQKNADIYSRLSALDKIVRSRGSCKTAYTRSSWLNKTGKDLEICGFDDCGVPIICGEKEALK